MSKPVKTLNEALDLVSMIKLSHDAVDIMALAKQKIRVAIAAIEAAEKETAEETA